MSKVCGRVRGDAFVVAQEAGFDNLREIIDVRPCGIDTLISNMRETVFPRLNTSPKDYSASTVVVVNRTPTQT